MVLSSEFPVTQVVIADYSKTVRLSLKTILLGQKQIKVIAAAKDGQETVQFCRNYQPDAVILNLQLPRLDGLNAAKIIRAVAPSTKIIAYSSISDPQAEVMVQTAPIDFYFPDFSAQKLIEVLNRINSDQALKARKLALEYIYAMSPLQEKLI